MQVIWVILAFIVGFVAGAIVRAAIYRDRPLGDLRVDQSDPDSGPMLFLELDTDVHTVMRKKLVTFRVKLENFLPHK